MVYNGLYNPHYVIMFRVYIRMLARFSAFADFPNFIK